ncbi:MAG TPA: class II aldolase/adducin family protein [Stellaceae bacterium]|nr:class II aldolase/adducin family protein [Stellaceae bacterium]
MTNQTTANPNQLGPDLLGEIVDANHILFHQGVVDAFGHVSARHDKHPDRFLLARNMAPAQVEREDIIEFDLDGTPLNAEGRRVYLERFIHGEIYRARPDVMAIVHSHSPSVVPFSVVKSVRFRPACHMCGFLGTGADIFEIRDTAGPATDLLIRDAKLGKALADSLGSANVVLMRGHGSTVVGPSVKQAVYRAVYTEVNARLVADALRLGPVEYLTPEEAETALAIEKEIERPWQFWKAAARAAG